MAGEGRGRVAATSPVKSLAEEQTTRERESAREREHEHERALGGEASGNQRFQRKNLLFFFLEARSWEKAGSHNYYLKKYSLPPQPRPLPRISPLLMVLPSFPQHGTWLPHATPT